MLDSLTTLTSSIVLPSHATNVIAIYDARLQGVVTVATTSGGELCALYIDCSYIFRYYAASNQRQVWRKILDSGDIAAKVHWIPILRLTSAVFTHMDAFWHCAGLHFDEWQAFLCDQRHCRLLWTANCFVP